MRVVRVVGHLVSANGPLAALETLREHDAFEDLDLGIFFRVLIPAAFYN